MTIQGGHSSIDQRAGVVVGAGAIFTNDGEVCSGARSTSQPTNPSAFAGAAGTAVMAGLAGSFTPNSGGNALVIIEGDVLNSTIGDGATLQISYGTGVAPANAATLTGTQTGRAVNFVAATATGKSPFAIMAYVTGLIAGTAYWLDLAVTPVTGGSVTVADVNIVAIEV
jgi:hypothetical protein